MVRYTRKYTPTTRKVAAARQAVNRAAKVLGRRGSPNLGLPRTGGFPGAYAQFRSFGGGARELKFIDSTIVNSPISDTGTILPINGIVQGTDFNQRIGRKIVMTSILWNMSLVPIGVTANTGEIVRCMLVYDSQTNSGSAPSLTDILVSADPWSPMNLNNRDRFKVIYDKRFTMYPSAYSTGVVTAGAPVTRWLSKYKKCRYEVIYSGVAASLGSIQTGAIYSVTVGSASSSVSQHNQAVRIRFYDS